MWHETFNQTTSHPPKNNLGSECKKMYHIGKQDLQGERKKNLAYNRYHFGVDLQNLGLYCEYLGMDKT
jgi:hypothetical protein